MILRLLLIVLFSNALIGCAGTSVVPGKVHGDISYTDLSPDITNYLNTHPVIPNPGSAPELFPVRVYSPGDLTASATAEYMPDNIFPVPLTFQAGHFEIYPNVDAAGTDLLLTIDKLAFTNGSTYRFGSIDPASPFTTQCNGVTPVETNPSGTQCDIGECAALLDLRLQFTGDAADLDAIEDDDLPSIPCEVLAYSEDVPGSGDLAFQASSGSQYFTLQELISGNAQIEMLVRGVTTPVEVRAGCSVQIKNGETGFVVIPATGRTPLSGERSISSAGCAQTVAPPPVEIPVERQAGMLTGYFDISGYDETVAQVCVDSYGSLFCETPPLVPANSVPDTKWEFEGILAGDHRVLARAVLGTDMILEFPSRNGPNLPVEIILNTVTDIGSTFVSQTLPLTGKINLTDPGGNTDLGQFTTPAFDSVYATYVSYMQAKGDEGMAAVVNGASGIDGISKGRLLGSYDTNQNLAQLNYNLLLNGISNPDGNINGQNARPTPWDLDLFALHMEPEVGGYEQITVYPALDLHYTFNLTDQPDEGVFVAPDQNFCFGRQIVKFQISPQLGSIKNPGLYSLRQHGLFTPTTTGMTPVAYVGGFARGVPDSTSTGAHEASVNITLPEGFQYRATPYIYFSPADGGATTYMYLDPLYFPAEGVLGCGADGDLCIDLQDEDGNYSQLSISVTDSTGLQTPEFCITDGNLDLNIQVNSDGNDVTRVAYQFDPVASDTCFTGPATELCATGCGPDPAFPVGLSGIAPGEHTFVACATGVTGCEVTQSYTFNVEAQVPAIQCSADFSVTVTEAEIPILASDSRIASNLGAQVTGNCGLPAGIIDDRPLEFDVGTTPVNFVAAGIGDCVTNVTVRAVDRHISYIEHDSLIDEDVIRTRSYLDDSVDRIEYSHSQTYHYEYSDNGNHIAVIPNGGSGAVRIIDRINGVTTIFPVPSGFTLHDIAFDPLNLSRYAFVGTDTTNSDQHAIFVYSGDVQLSRFDLPVYPPALRISRPLIAWSPDSSKITGSFTQPNPAINNYTLWMSEWNVVNDNLVNPDAVTQNRQVRENLHELVYQDDDWRALGSNNTVSLGIKRPGNEVLGAVFAVENADIDLPPDGSAAAFVQYIDITPGDAARPGFAAPIISTNVPTPAFGPTHYPISYKPSIAVSSDSNYVALGLDDKIIVYSVPDFVPIKEFAVDRPRNIEFKPFE